MLPWANVSQPAKRHIDWFQPFSHSSRKWPTDWPKHAVCSNMGLVTLDLISNYVNQSKTRQLLQTMADVSKDGRDCVAYVFFD